MWREALTSQLLLCVSVTAETTNELRARRDTAAEADLVELRLDSVKDPDVAGALVDRRCPVIVTCRPVWEGGWFRGSEEERRTLLAEALNLGAEYVDIEWRGGLDDLVRQRRGRNIVLSMHDFEGVPADLGDRFRAMRATGAQVVKLAVSATRLCDGLPLLDIGTRAAADASTVLIAMGAAGLPTRLLAARFGSCWTYAGEGVAPGQISAARMLGEFRFRQVTATSDVYGVLGTPLAHSVSPAMHNAGFAAGGEDAVYVPFEAADLEDFVSFAERLRVRGVSVTAPFKQTLLARVEDIDATSREVGALNTVRIDGRRWQGLNTDVPGFLEPLRRFDLAGSRAAVVGAGGAARAVCVALASRRAKVAVYARDGARAAEVARIAGGTAHPMPPPPGSWDVLVNTTPVGTYPHVDQTPMPGGALDGRLVYDLVYNPLKTRLVVDADRAGCQTIGGLEMLVAQAERQFEWWTGRRPGPALFKQAALRRLGELGGVTGEVRQRP